MNGFEPKTAFLQNGVTFNVFQRTVGKYGELGTWSIAYAMKAVDKKDAVVKLKEKMPWLRPVDNTIYGGFGKQYYVSQVS